MTAESSRDPSPPEIADSLHRARSLAVAGDDEAAKQTYLRVLRLDPSHVRALIELGALAEASGHRSAARSAYQEAVRVDPDETTARTGLANVLRESGDLAQATIHYRAALAVDPEFALAHQGLAQTLAALGDPADRLHWCAGFEGHSVVRRRYRGQGTGIPLLLLVAARGGNVPTSRWIDNRRFAVTAVFADFHHHAEPLPRHAVIVNAIGDADSCADALSAAERIVAGATVPIINHPTRVRATGRRDNARRLAAVPGVVTPITSTHQRRTIADAGALRFPLLLRSPGFHTGQNFVRVETREALPEIAAGLPGEELLVIQVLDARGADGMARKYRVMFIDGTPYPLHLAVMPDWKVHYFTAAMAERPDLREEERRFLTDPLGTLGHRAMTALCGVRNMLGLDYCGIDFALAADGSVLLFEANATMVINPAEPGSIWDYRRPAIEAATNAAISMVSRTVQKGWETRLSDSAGTA